MKDLFAKLATLFRQTWVWSLCLVLLTALPMDLQSLLQSVAGRFWILEIQPPHFDVLATHFVSHLFVFFDVILVVGHHRSVLLLF